MREKVHGNHNHNYSYFINYFQYKAKLGVVVV